MWSLVTTHALPSLLRWYEFPEELSPPSYGGTTRKGVGAPAPGGDQVIQTGATSLPEPSAHRARRVARSRLASRDVGRQSLQCGSRYRIQRNVEAVYDFVPSGADRRSNVS